MGLDTNKPERIKNVFVVVILVTIVLTPAWALGGPQESICHLRGDLNSDGRISLADAVYLEEFLGGNIPAPACLATANLHQPEDSGLDIADENEILHYVFRYLYAPSSADHCETWPIEGFESEPRCLEYNPTPAPVGVDAVRIESVTADPGERISVGVYVSNASPVDAFQLVLEYDPDVIYPFLFDRLEFDGTFFEDFAAEALAHPGLNFRRTRVRPGEDDGVLLIGFYPGAYCAFGRCEGEENLTKTLPTSEDTLVFKIPMLVRRGSTVGPSSIRLSNGPDGQGFSNIGLVNELSAAGTARIIDPDFSIPGGVDVLPNDDPECFMRVSADIIIFIRGDANLDSIADMTDAILVLEHLFLGRPESLQCPDAADADDSGIVDITDPIEVLRHQFLGVSVIAAPYPNRGHDRTFDQLGPCVTE